MGLHFCNHISFHVFFSYYTLHDVTMPKYDENGNEFGIIDETEQKKITTLNHFESVHSLTRFVLEALQMHHSLHFLI